MKKNILGIFILLVAIFVITAMINPKFLNAYNMQNLIKWSSLYAVMSLGVAFVIITGGIDLSIGSVVGLVAVVLSICLKLGNGSVECNWHNSCPFSSDWISTWRFDYKSKGSALCGHPVWIAGLSKYGPMANGQSIDWTDTT